MPFDYQSYHSPYTATIADLIAKPYELRARAAEAQGQSAGQMAESIGRAGSQVAGTIGDLLKYRADAPKRLADLQHLQAETSTLNAQAADRQHQLEGEKQQQTEMTAATGIANNAPLVQAPDGTWVPNRQVVQNSMRNAKIGTDAQGKILGLLDKTEEHIKAVQKNRTEAIAATAYAVIHAGGTQEAIDLGLQIHLANGLISERDAAGLKEQLSANPDHATEILQSLARRSPDIAKLMDSETPKSDYASALKRFETGLGRPMTADDELAFKAKFDAAGRAPVRPAAVPNVPLEQQLLDAMRKGDKPEEQRLRSAMNARDNPKEPKKEPGADDPELPRGVQDYLFGMTQRQVTTPSGTVRPMSFDEAKAELQRTLPALRRDHPKLDTVKATDALKKFYARDPSNPSDLETLIAELANGGKPSGTVPPASGGGTSPRRAAAPPTSLPSAGPRVGAVVKLKDGRQVTVTKVNPDGTFEAH